MINFDGKVLAQSRPSATTATSLYSPARIARLDSIIVTNTTSTVAKISLFVDNNGTTYDQSTALLYQSVLSGNGVYEWVFADGQGIVLNSNSANFAVQTDTASALTFTLFGEEKID